MKLTDYQKKKFIDLTLLIVAVVAVGFFLKTQLDHPVIIETEVAPSDYTVGKMTYENLEISSLTVLSSILKTDASFCEMHLLLTNDQDVIKEWAFDILYDVNGDQESDGDVTVAVRGNNGVYTAEITYDDKQGYGEVWFENQTLTIRIPNQLKYQITDETAYRFVENE